MATPGVGGRADHAADLAAVGDVAGVEADLRDARVDGLQRAVEVEVHVGRDGHGAAADDFAKGGGVVARGHGQADQFRTGRRQRGRLPEASTSAVRVLAMLCTLTAPRRR